MPTTSNFGWTTPADTDLVKDGAAAIRTLGNGIDTSFLDLKGGTTGQILSKASNTDLDYTWINNEQGDITAVTAGTGLTGGGTTGAVTLTNDMATTITASGDIVVGTGNGTYDNLPIGTTGQVLTADTTVSPYKVKWAAAGSSPSYTSIASGSLPTGVGTLTISGISGKNDLILLVTGWSGTTATPSMYAKINNNAANYYTAGQYFPTESSSPYAMLGRNWSYNARSDLFGCSLDATGSTGSLYLTISGCNAAGVKPFRVIGSAGTPASANTETTNYGGFWDDTATVSSLVIYINAGNFDAGSYYLYGA